MPSEYCSPHNEKVYNACLTCRKYLCSKCRVEHKDHYILAINEITDFISENQHDLYSAAQLKYWMHLQDQIDAVLRYNILKCQSHANILNQKLQSQHSMPHGTHLSYGKLYQVFVDEQKIKSEFQIIKQQIDSIIKKPMVSPPIVHYIKGNTIKILNVSSLSINTQPITQFVNKSSESISIGKNIYIVGGELTNQTICVNSTTMEFTTKSHMKVNKYKHTLCLIGDYIYSIGGFNDSGYINDSERYNYITNAWENLPPLLEAKGFTTCVAVRNRGLCVIGGNNRKNEILSTVDLLTSTPSVMWKPITNTTLKGRYLSHAIQLPNSKILIFGGLESSNSEACDSSYILSIGDDNSINVENHIKLEVKSYFYKSSVPALIKDRVFAVDKDARFHIYDIPSAKWQCKQ